MGTVHSYRYIKYSYEKYVAKSHDHVYKPPPPIITDLYIWIEENHWNSNVHSHGYIAQSYKEYMVKSRDHVYNPSYYHSSLYSAITGLKKTIGTVHLHGYIVH